MDKESDVTKYCLPYMTGAIYTLRQNPEDKKENVPFRLVKKEKITHDTFIFTFQLPDGEYLGVDLGQHLSIEALIKSDMFPDGEFVSRKYTPVSHIYEKGKFDLLIKVYYKTEAFPEGGKLTQWIDQLELGRDVLMRGPLGRLNYFGDGHFKLGRKGKPMTYKEKKYKKVGMLAGGSGITPMFQILQAAHLNCDSVEYTLIYGNRTSNDILLKGQLDEFYQKKNFNFSLHYTIDKPEDNWDGLVGYIDKEKIISHLPPPAEDTLILLCGSGKMCKKYLTPLLVEIGYNIDDIFKF